MPTKFQLRVYKIVKKIRKGEVMTYGQIARKLKTSPREVGQALKKNYNKKIPCHRVICSNGKIGGYNRGVKLKRKLLIKERAIF